MVIKKVASTITRKMISDNALQASGRYYRQSGINNHVQHVMDSNKDIILQASGRNYQHCNISNYLQKDIGCVNSGKNNQLRDKMIIYMVARTIARKTMFVQAIKTIICNTTKLSKRNIMNNDLQSIMDQNKNDKICL
ncbi:hypothetical protein RFI_04227 [Reticulomyxa filosa]|uniref:Uncharacterized protein n=1 Tax=Reticulomyxa filosa TaxID=46433 RepID=X6P5M1_RETFI|nr:hypothetical protein RFI_04227 [Reticulomyxa filosa]|eukprot:ETO32892.1 hypothetical protein RFI_04227 [Reticulomyxa filosa]